MGQGRKIIRTSRPGDARGIFVTGTDTGVGKTVAVAVLGHLLKMRGLSVGVLKPVQCGGNDSRRLKASLGLTDPLKTINPFFASEPISPHLAFPRAGVVIDIQTIKDTYQRLAQNYDVVLVEGAGGVSVPLKKGFIVADLIRELDLGVVIVSRLGLGTINHTLLTINQCRDHGLTVHGVIFSQTKKHSAGIPEKTNPSAIKEFGGVSILGTIPPLRNLSRKEIILKCRSKIRTDLFLGRLRPGMDDQLPKWDKKYLWHPFTQMKDWLAGEPLVIDRARGNYLIDINGKRYLDGVSSLWVNVHGHGHRHIDRAVKSQVDRLSHSTFLGLSNTPAIRLANKLVEITPRGLEKVFYSDNGSTACEVAIKIAFQYWQNIGKVKKTKIVHLKNSYHGDTLGSVSVGGIDLFHKVYKGLIFKTIQMDSFDVTAFEKTLKDHHDRIAAVMVEPLIQGAAGMILWPKGVLRKFREICRRYQVIFIADEVATGFGRTGKMFACEHERVSPDIMCLAKGLTGGYLPLAATLTTKKIFNGFLFDYKDQKTFFHGHTYTGNPLACAAALANLEVFEQERVLSRMQPKIKYLSKSLKVFYNLKTVGDIRQLGFMVGIELVKDRTKSQVYSWDDQVGIKVCRLLREKGVILRPLGNVIVLMPPLSMSIKELKALLSALYQAISEVTL